ncbi:carotenoid oxygenase family protein [Nocardia iowensis]|uniref:Dioxygenase n=1 Tax=Nocardia iowensis TaxID=204891 RepID=A0ABX8RXX1_NOCIO|nr:carotenoid oxygenase family protein [Nocardia iowensis]QXN94525.1 carotenoid oxygenase family protein [Nocardia iowensis]
MPTTPNADLPLHLAGNNAPATEEVTAEPTDVIGVIPKELSGTYFRNGPNPRTGWSPHYFAGDGMVHAVALDGGRARWYRNRYVRTPLYAHPGQSRLALAFDQTTGQVDYRVTTANTHVVAHAGRLLALEEGGFPYEITPELETVGPFTFNGALHTPMTAHPKICPRTGELLFFGVRLRPPYLTYYRAAPTGELLRAQVVRVPRATMMHDFAITETSVVFMDLPVVFDPVAAAGGMPWRWDDGHGARFGVMGREGGDVRWFDVEPCYVWHTMNAFEADGVLTVTGTRVPTLWREGSDDIGGGLPRLHQWRLNLGTGTVAEQPLDDAAVEYPRVADTEIGQRHRFGYITSFSLDAEPEHSTIYKYDLTDDASRQMHRLPTGHTCGEAVFVPRHDTARDDDGYLMTFTHDRANGTSYLAILDATDLTARPVAQIHLPVRVPAGFHGNWLPSR